MSAVLGIGTATFMPGYGLAADAPAKGAAVALLRDAISAGIRYIDTAAGYGDAESIVGAVADEVRSRGVRVCTKAAVAHGALLDQARASLRRLALDQIDTLLVHSADAATLSAASVDQELATIHSQRLARRTGASTYGIADAHRALAQRWCGAIQVEHSILNTSVVDALPAGRQHAEIIVRSVLCKGLLTSRRQHAAAFTQELATTLDALERVAAEWGWALPELAIRFALDTPGVGVVIVGVSTEAELTTAVRAMARAPLPAEAFTTLRRFECSALDAAHPERWGNLELHRT